MNKEEIMKKVSELIGEGNIEKAHQFIDDHQDDLGEYAEKAKSFLKDHEDDVEGLMAKAKDFLGDEGNDLLGKVKGLFGKK